MRGIVGVLLWIAVCSRLRAGKCGLWSHVRDRLIVVVVFRRACASIADSLSPSWSDDRSGGRMV